MTWRDLSDDPNSTEALAARRAVLEAAASAVPIDRLDVIAEVATGRRVVDVGCVDHFAASADAETWLHRHVAGLASECVGVDIEADGVEAMRAAGYDVVLHDITRGAGPLADLPRFDAVVAGELIEHLDSPRLIFDFARDVLKPGGHLVITTPNPYSWRRVRAGQRAMTWENVDHVTYVPPTGVVEMAERAGGLRLVRFGSNANPRISYPLRASAGFLRRVLREGPRFWEHDVDAVTPAVIAASASRPASMRGETMTYLLVREQR